MEEHTLYLSRKRLLTFVKMEIFYWSTADSTERSFRRWFWINKEVSAIRGFLFEVILRLNIGIAMAKTSM